MFRSQNLMTLNNAEIINHLLSLFEYKPSMLAKIGGELSVERKATLKRANKLEEEAASNIELAKAKKEIAETFVTEMKNLKTQLLTKAELLNSIEALIIKAQKQSEALRTFDRPVFVQGGYQQVHGYMDDEYVESTTNYSHRIRDAGTLEDNLKIVADKLEIFKQLQQFENSVSSEYKSGIELK